MIFFFPDTLRAESFNSYGNKVQMLLQILNLCRKWRTFQRSRNAHNALKMHNDDWSLYARFGASNTDSLVRAYEENYWRLLKEHGYHIAWYGKNDALSAAAFNLSVSEWETTLDTTLT